MHINVLSRRENISKGNGFGITQTFSWIRACNDIISAGLNGGASDTVRARNIGLKEEKGNRT